MASATSHVFSPDTCSFSSAVASWRVKETERMVAIRTELTKVGHLSPVLIFQLLVASPGLNLTFRVSCASLEQP